MTLIRGCRWEEVADKFKESNAVLIPGYVRWNQSKRYHLRRTTINKNPELLLQVHGLLGAKQWHESIYEAVSYYSGIVSEFEHETPTRERTLYWA